MQGSRKVVYAGLAANVAIAVTKLVIAGISGSSSMLAEGFHSVVDTGNSLMLLLGMKRSRRPAHAQHPFGHGKELYFWSFVVAISMFAVGGVLSIWEGVAHLRHPMLPEKPMWSLIVLAVSACMSTASLIVALREVYRTKGDAGLLEFIHRSKDPSVFTVVLEDGSDLAGEAIAFLAIALGYYLHNPYLDAIGSILIGMVILSVSFVLANESRELLIGETAPAHHVEHMKQLLQNDGSVERVGNLLTMQLGPNDVLLNVEIQFQRQSRVEDLEQTIARLEKRIREEYPEVKHLFVEVARVADPKPTYSRAS